MELRTSTADEKNSPAFYAALLRSCARSQDLSTGRRIHRRIIATEHRQNKFLQNLAMEMYGKCGSPDEARRVFDSIPSKNVFSWNIMMAAYAHSRRIEDARDVFDRMPLKDVVSWNTILAAYAAYGQLDEAKVLFDKMPQRTVVSWNTITAALVHYGRLIEAREMFDKIVDPNAVSWNIMLVAYAQSGDFDRAEEIFAKIPDKDVASWNTMIASYADAGNIEKARKIFQTMPVRDVVSWNAMITAFSRTGHLQEAKVAFDTMPKRNLVSWNAMITAYSEAGECDRAVAMLGLMDLEGMEPNDVTIIALLTVCGSTAKVTQGRIVHSSISSKNRLVSHVVVATALINMYGNCSSMEEAWIVFAGMDERNTVTWNALISGYVHNSNTREAFMLYAIMNLEGAAPNLITFVAALDACAGNLALAQGKIIHGLAAAAGYADDVVLATALVNLYAKCGCLGRAAEIFHAMPVKSEVTWNSIIAIHASFGLGSAALRFFQMMHLQGEEPSGVTLINTLTAFSHTGLARGGAAGYLVSILIDYRGLLELDHFVCVIDILGRAGWLQEAEDLIGLMPFEPDSLCWMTLLGACKLHGDRERGTVAADNVFRLDPGNPAPYVLLSSICSSKKLGRTSNGDDHSSTPSVKEVEVLL
ncbi:pentatricopeptide repeat-containing protein At4g02750-like [Selaginella moellendorffii]|uniref:pentatricopeptide repeat-containing protein At4g02750-like n=1 Tax=Selaginella moellendorffii TaxID=88036 RepID=UPI000D1C7229|nr:pentatricopeptide repeat-containing protein At4g02750-like [Selaginella moellendorffii]|eukprot:XP_024522784.1 pentatricopeptide repeat-containing protein At4g02750-like [Selaginella moellendorffii]